MQALRYMLVLAPVGFGLFMFSLYSMKDSKFAFLFTFLVV